MLWVIRIMPQQDMLLVFIQIMPLTYQKYASAKHVVGTHSHYA